MNTIYTMIEKFWIFLKNSPELQIFIAVISILSIVLPLLFVPFIIKKLPANYFCLNYNSEHKHTWLIILLRNIAALVITLIGIIFILTPGQGSITILTGLIIADFPYKKQLEVKFVNFPFVLTVLNKIRNKMQLSPFCLSNKNTTEDN